MKRTTAPALLGLACLLVMPAIAHARYRDGMNLYEYVRANPTGLLDPSGLAVTNDSLESGLGGDGWARSPRCLPSRPATPKEIAVGHLLASVDSRYVYSKATGLGEMIRGKLVPALRGVSWVTLDPDYKEPTYHYTSAASTDRVSC